MSKNKMRVGGYAWKSKRAPLIIRNNEIILDKKSFSSAQRKKISSMLRLYFFGGCFMGVIITYLVMR